MLTWMKGLGLLRHPELVRDLGERLQRIRLVNEVRRRQPTAKVSSEIELIGFEAERLTLGQRATIAKGSILSFGDDLNGRGAIRIGDDVWIGQYNNLRAGGGELVIGRDCLISQFCTLVASNHGTSREQTIRTQAPVSGRRSVILENDVWLGAGVTVLPGVTIHEGAVIGAGSVVTRDVPSFEVWAGSPARRISERS